MLPRTSGRGRASGHCCRGRATIRLWLFRPHHGVLLGGGDGVLARWTARRAYSIAGLQSPAGRADEWSGHL